MSSLAFCIWWFVAGVLVGWLFWQIFDRWFCRDGEAADERLQRDLADARSRIRLLSRGAMPGAPESAATGATAAGPMTGDDESSRPDQRLLALSDELRELRVVLSERDAEVARLRADVAEARLAAPATSALRSLRTTPPPAVEPVEGPPAPQTSGKTPAAAAPPRTGGRAARTSSPPADLQGGLFGFETTPSPTPVPGPASAEPQAQEPGLPEKFVAALAAHRQAGNPSGFQPQVNGRDNLQIIEGIGPRIEALLNSSGIDSFAILAAVPVDRLQRLLDDAGPAYRLAKPGSWAMQARLCAEGDWAGLRQLQDRLIAGVDPDAPDL